MSYTGTESLRRAALLAGVAVFVAAVIGTRAQTPSPAKTTALAQAPASSPTVKVQTKLITVDVVANDSHGDPVRGLKKEDFQIFEEHNREQQIVQFEFLDRAANAVASAAAASPASATFTNEISSNRTIPPTILLMDALNTDITNQSEVHRHMLMLLKTLPANTPLAVFSLGHELHVIQSFSTDPKLVRAAVDRALNPIPQDQNPQDDPNSPSNVALDQNGGTETTQTLFLEDLENQLYEQQTAIRVDETTDAMLEIAKYLTGYPGRKNLIWFSEAFPNWLAPQADSGTDPFIGSASYEDKIRKATEALNDAQVAIYPVDAQGLAPDQLYSTSQTPHINHQSPGAGFAGQLRRQSNAHLDQQATMDEVAENTGGRICKNTNDLSGCVQSAISDGAVYYELSYYPEGVPWDGRFHKIEVKTRQHGVKLSYRRGYFATDVQTTAGGKNPQELLQDACRGPLPSTAIPLSVQPIAPDQSSGKPGAGRYLVTISSAPLSLPPAGGARQLSLQMAVCEYDVKGDKFQFLARDLSSSVPEPVYLGWQEHGIRDVFDYDARPEDTHLRFAVLDVPTGITGSVDVPAHPSQFASLPAGLAPAPVAPPQRSITTVLTFKSSSGKSARLDWSAGKVTYQGDLGIELGASGFFQKYLGANYHCQAGALVANDPKSTAVPRLGFLLQSASGPSVLVDLTGSEPTYSGSLPVDEYGKSFFIEVWKLCHCQAP